ALDIELKHCQASVIDGRDDCPSAVPRPTSSTFDDLAIMLRRPTWKAMEDGLNDDLGTLVAYFQRWRLQLNIGKTVAAYHLSTREARRELEVRVNNKRLEVQQAPKYLVCVWIGHCPSNNTLKKSRPSGILRPSLEQKPSRNGMYSSRPVGGAACHRIRFLAEPLEHRERLLHEPLSSRSRAPESLLPLSLNGSPGAFGLHAHVLPRISFVGGGGG
ncbi:hypothetical protein JOQ06_022009, partial [Pogonophryne albipinna]